METRKKTIRVILAVVMVCSFATSQVNAKDKSTGAEIKDRMIERRAIEAAVWGMPIVNFQAMRDGLKKDVGVGPKAPARQQANWVPTTPNKNYWRYFRFYGPKPAVFTKSWKLPDLGEVK